MLLLASTACFDFGSCSAALNLQEAMKEFDGEIKALRQEMDVQVRAGGCELCKAGLAAESSSSAAPCLIMRQCVSWLCGARLLTPPSAPASCFSLLAAAPVPYFRLPCLSLLIACCSARSWTSCGSTSAASTPRWRRSSRSGAAAARSWCVGNVLSSASAWLLWGGGDHHRAAPLPQGHGAFRVLLLCCESSLLQPCSCWVAEAV